MLSATSGIHDSSHLHFFLVVCRGRERSNIIDPDGTSAEQRANNPNEESPKNSVVRRKGTTISRQYIVCTCSSAGEDRCSPSQRPHRHRQTLRQFHQRGETGGLEWASLHLRCSTGSVAVLGAWLAVLRPWTVVKQTMAAPLSEVFAAFIPQNGGARLIWPAASLGLTCEHALLARAGLRAVHSLRHGWQ